MLTNCKINNFKINAQIGSGAFGLVFHTFDTITHREYAIKAVMKKSQQSNNSDNVDPSIKKSTILETQLYHFFKTYQDTLYLPSVDLDSISNLTDKQLESIPHYREIALHLKVHYHSNIVTIHQVLESPIATFIVMDYYPIDLFTSIVDCKHFTEDGLLIKKVFLQLCSALNYCHERGIYHCDIKPENILLDMFDNIYLCDFGLATTSPYLAPNTCVGSSYYMAPERVLCKDYDNESKFPTTTGDIWSLGIILINLTCVRNPWLKAHQVEDNTFRHFVEDSTVLQKLLPISNDLYFLLSRILRMNPFERINLNDLMKEVEDIISFTLEGSLANVPRISNNNITDKMINPLSLKASFIK